MRAVIAQVGVGFALLLGLLGQVITFVPGASAGWFGVAACGAAVGLISPSRRFRAFAAALAIGLAWLSWVGYREGLRHREILRSRPRSAALPEPEVDASQELLMSVHS